MARGEARYSSAGKQVHRFDNTPIPVGDYQLLLVEEGLSIKRSVEKGPDAIPYVNTWLRALDTAPKEGQKDRLVFHKYFLSMKPGSDGIIMPERGGGIVEFCRSHGEEADFQILTLVKSDKTTEDYFDPEEVMEYLKTKLDDPRQAHVIIEAQKDHEGNAVKGHPGNNKVAYWELDAEGVTGQPEPAPSAPRTAKGATNLPKSKRK